MSEAMMMAQVVPQMVMAKLKEYSDEDIVSAFAEAKTASRSQRVGPREAIIASIQAYFLGCECHGRGLK